MSGTAEIKYNGKSLELPVVIGSENEEAIDIGQLRAKSGLITLDAGFKNTGSTQSAITFLDGEKGKTTTKIDTCGGQCVTTAKQPRKLKKRGAQSVTFAKQPRKIKICVCFAVVTDGAPHFPIFHFCWSRYNL